MFEVNRMGKIQFTREAGNLFFLLLKRHNSPKYLRLIMLFLALAKYNKGGYIDRGIHLQTN